MQCRRGAEGEISEVRRDSLRGVVQLAHGGTEDVEIKRYPKLRREILHEKGA